MAVVSAEDSALRYRDGTLKIYQPVVGKMFTRMIFFV